MSKKRNYSEEDLENAVRQAVTIGQRKSTRLNNVPLATLQRRLKTADTKFTNRGVKPALSKEVERELLSAIITFKEVGFGLTRKDVSKSSLQKSHYTL